MNGYEQIEGTEEYDGQQPEEEELEISFLPEGWEEDEDGEISLGTLMLWSVASWVAVFDVVVAVLS